MTLLSYRTSEINPITKGTDVICQIWPLQVAVIPVPPGREESTPQAFRNMLWADWIPPALAGRE